MKRALLFLCAVIFWAQPSFATCGLRSCPVEARQSEASMQPIALIGLTSSVGAYQTNQIDANYFVSTLQAQFFVRPWLKAAVDLPVATLRQNGQRKTGLSDLLVELSASPFSWNNGKSMLWFGNQIEIPTGSESDGLGSGHFEILPYASVHHSLGKIVGYARVGSRLSLGSESHGAGAAILEGSTLDPHADSEFVFRVGSLLPLAKKLSAELSLSGQTVLAKEGRGNTSLSVEPRFIWTVLRQLELQLFGQVPVGSNQRFDWRAGAGVSYSF